MLVCLLVVGHRLLLAPDQSRGRAPCALAALLSQVQCDTPSLPSQPVLAKELVSIHCGTPVV